MLDAILDFFVSLMRNLGLYLPILTGLAVFFVLALVIHYHRRRSRCRTPSAVIGKQAACEEFRCIKTTLKQVNENFYIAQLVFTNRMSVTLNTHPKVPRQISED